METRIIGWDEVNLAVDALKKGEAICFPTETVYGIGILSSKKEYFEKLVALKERPADKPFTLMCSSICQVVRHCKVNSRIINVMKKFMPGEITLILDAREGEKDYLSLSTNKIGVRVPNSNQVLDMIEKVGEPLLVPSANKSGFKPSLTSKEAYSYFNNQIPFVIDGECVSNTPSTIVDLSNNQIKLIREGKIPFEDIKKVFEEEPSTISIGADHGAFDLKNDIAAHSKEMGFIVIDEGTYSKESCDYPIFAKKVANDIVSNKASLGIVCCTSGIGISIACNKVKGIRCGVGYDDVLTGKCREHNNCNVISFGAAYMKEEDVLRRVDIFLSEKFSPLVKHHRRVEEIENI